MANLSFELTTVLLKHCALNHHSRLNLLPIPQKYDTINYVKIHVKTKTKYVVISPFLSWNDMCG